MTGAAGGGTPRNGANAREARVLVVDDSTFVRKALRKVFESRSGLTVAGEAGDGLEAVRMCGVLAPDIVTLDIQMPGMDGLAALKEIKRLWPDLPVLVLASAASNGPEVAMEALALGAFEFVDKGQFRSMDFQIMGEEVVRKVRAGLAASAPPPAAELPAAPVPPRPARRAAGPGLPRTDVEAVCIGASTGGPAALGTILGRLPAGFPFPIAIVQHMPMGFTAAFAERLNQSSRLEVREARGGEAFLPGWAFLAPAGQHLVFEEGPDGVRVELSAEPAGGSHVPSVDVLLAAAARTFGRRAIGIVLTGMGSDGREGAKALVASGGTVVAESEESCAVYGMPRAVVEAGLASAVWSADEIGSELRRMAGAPPEEGGEDR
ncbi:MAG: chemotaxis-specific protein-glutamate methyltransferase CheB [Thermoanaerobaculia bacterium]